MTNSHHIHPSQSTADAWEAAMRYCDMASRAETTGAFERANWYAKIAADLLAETVELSNPEAEATPIGSAAERVARRRR